MNQDSSVINAVRLPLAVLVVLIHSYIPVQGWNMSIINYAALTGRDIYSLFCITLSHVLSEIAVPLFFFISGYLFFLNLYEWNWDVWKRKLFRRIKTLLIPYLIWCTLFAIISVIWLIMRKGVDGLVDWYKLVGLDGIYWCDPRNTVIQYNLLGFNSIITSPLLMPMWFLRDLMVVISFTPIIWFFLKKISILLLLLMGCLWLLGFGTQIPGVSLISLFMFSWGGYYSCKQKSFIEMFRKFDSWPLYFLFLILMFICIKYGGNTTQLGQVCLNCWVLTAIPVILIILQLLIVRKKKVVYWLLSLSNRSFFIYACHGIIISYLYRFLWLVLGVETVGDKLSSSYINNHLTVCIVSYILTPVITILSCLFLYKLFVRMLPTKMMTLLVGKIR